MNLRTVPGWAWMVACAASFCAMGVLVRELTVEHAVNVFWIGWVRYLLGLAVMAIPAATGAWSLRVHNKPVFIARGILGSVGLLFFFLAVSMVGLGRGTVLFYLMGVFGTLAGMVLLREHPRPLVWVAVVVSVAGVLLSAEAGWPRGGEWAGLIAAVFSGTTLALVRLLRRTDSNQVTFYGQGLWGSLLLAVPALLSPMPLGWGIWLMLIAMSFLDIVGQLFMTQGLSMIPVAKGGALMMLIPIFSLLVGVIGFGESLTLLQWAGCGLVLLASFLAVISRSHPKQPRRSVPSGQARP